MSKMVLLIIKFKRKNMTNQIIYTVPNTGFLRLKQIIGDPKSNPPIDPIIPIGKSTWWEGVKTGRFPKPVKIGPPNNGLACKGYQGFY